MEKILSFDKIIILDGTFLPDHPVKMMERGEYNHVDLMVGLNKVKLVLICNIKIYVIS